MQKQSTKNSPDIIEQGMRKISQFMSGEENIVSVILEDHKPLKELISVMKGEDTPFEERLQAFKEFAPLLITHAKAEEKSLYEAMKAKPELKMLAFEGDTEHSLADQLAEEIERVTDREEMAGKIKVIAELVEHHIQEEENDLLPEVKKAFGQEELKAMTGTYNKVMEEMIALGQDDSPKESEVDLKH